ncbi:hypothetical protein [[Kitasatospora] papulosa]|uniref:hypothetical protein n=1 Tax=[Kitasatospora] papulosa TaxID=1464011 RepID=UPI000B07D968
MINAAEAAIEQGAEDDAERKRIRTRLYAPPKGSRPQRRVRPPGMGFDAAGAQALAQQLEAEDERLTGRRSG